MAFEVTIEAAHNEQNFVDFEDFLLYIENCYADFAADYYQMMADKQEQGKILDRTTVFDSERPNAGKVVTVWDTEQNWLDHANNALIQNVMNSAKNDGFVYTITTQEI